MADWDVSMVALKDHPGYGYNGSSGTLVVREGDSFTTTPARAARLVEKGLAAVSEKPIPVVEPVSAEPPSEEKVDKRSKAYRDGQKK